MIDVLISTTAKIKWNGRIKKHYVDLGYKFTKMGDEFEVKVEHLTKGSHAIVQWQCDGENCNEIITGTYYDYLKCVKNDGKIYCSKCASNNGKFYSVLQYAIDNNRLTELNIRKNYELGIDLNKVSYNSNITKIWCLCVNKETPYHNDFGGHLVTCCNFSKGSGCPYCANQKVHPLDSVGQDIINNYGEDFLWKVWSDKNTISPFDLSPGSNIKVWWNCLDENKNHEPYLRSCYSSKSYNYRCPKCVNEYYSGENHPNWNPNLTQEERENGRHIEGYTQFIKDVMDRDNYTCQITGVISNGHNLVVHHIDGYNWCKEKRTNVDNGIVLCKQIHKLFHKLYGKGDNTEEQFNEFLELIENGDIDISNIN